MNSWLRQLASSSSKTSRIRVTSNSSRFSRRNVHVRRPLPYPIEHGLGDFLPPKALRTIAVDWQDGLLSRLNDEVRGIPELENLSIVQTIIDTAEDRQHTLAFNYASLALNNSYFLENLKPPPVHRSDHEHEIPLPLANIIETEFGDLDQLKSNIGAAATGMSSSGWVFLVTDGRNRLGVLSTFGPGTLLVQSRTPMTKFFNASEQIRRAEDVVSSNSEAITSTPQSLNDTTSASYSATPKFSSRFWNQRSNLSHDRQASIYGGGSVSVSENKASDKYEKVGERLYPLFCVCVYEHAWMSADYGVWGLEEYLKRFWTVLDWVKVSNSFVQFNPGITVL